MYDHSKREEDVEWIKAKVADLEDRSRWKNLKIRGIPESVKPASLRDYFVQLISDILPEVPLAELIVDCMHRLPKHPNLPEKTPRDTIVCIWFYHTKEKLLWVTRNTAAIPR